MSVLFDKETITSIKMPFEGFYDSVISSLIYDELEELNEEHPEKDTSINFGGIAKEVVNCYKTFLENHFDLVLNSIEFDSLWSPRFYNFETDEITLNINGQDLEKLFKYFQGLDLDTKQGLINNISEYASKDHYELFAESYAMYVRGDKLPKIIKDYLDKYLTTKDFD